MQRMRVPMKVAALLGGLVLLIGSAIALTVFAQVWAEYRWFASMGHSDVFFTQLWSKGALWLSAAVVSSLVIYASGSIAARYRTEARWVRGAVAGASVLLGALISWSLAGHWMEFRVALAGFDFGIAEPHFGVDVGFFVFTLPALELLTAWINGVLTVAAICAAAVTVFPEKGDSQPVLVAHWKELRPLFSVIFGVLVLNGAFRTWLAMRTLDLTSQSQFVGIGYTNAHVTIVALWVSVAISIAIGAAAIIGARSSGWRVLGSLLGVWFLASMVLGSAWPAVVDHFVVAPNELTSETPYLNRNIEMTRHAWGLDESERVALEVEDKVDGTAAARVAQALSRTRLWTPGSVKRAFTQLQVVRPYYALSSIETDRYEIDHELTQVLVSAREIDPESLPQTARTWENQHLVYTHGYGVVVCSASGATEQGFPTFLVGDVPPRISDEVSTTAPTLEIAEPRIYFGTQPLDYAIINTGIEEFDHPDGDANVYSTNGSDAGVPMGDGVQRVLWALRLGTDEVLFSDYIGQDSRLLLHRNVLERARLLAPWVDFDENPYPAIVDGRVLWILDGLTSSDHFPYSQRVDGTNYARESVKVIIDAASGETHFYAVGDDPVRDAWSTIYPTLIEPESSIPAAAAAHFRVPEKLFVAQSSIYRSYHVTDARVFYNREDEWEYSGQRSDDPIESSYLLFRPPGAAKAGLYIIRPYAPAGGDNLIGWVATSCEPEDYGHTTIFALPKNRVVMGPKQLEARIEQDPEISPTLSLWNQRGSKVVFGDMVLLPVENTVAAIQPIFIQAEKTAITELASVVVICGDHVEMDSTIDGALAKAFGEPSANAADTSLMH